MMKVHAGMLNETLTLETSTESEQDDGSVPISWSFSDSVPAWVRTLGGTELLEAQQMTPRADHKIVVRTIAGLRPGPFRWKRDGKVLSIVAVRATDHRRRWMECACREER